jgi:hypothetical protein
MADVTGRIGDNDVALDNAATEATLKALLLATAGSTKQMEKLINLASKAGMDPKSIEQANKGANALGQAAFVAGKVTSVAMNGLSKTAMVLGGVIGDLAASAFKTVGNLTDFAKGLLDGTATVSGLFAAFKDLPLGLGLVAGLFEKLAKMQEENLGAFRELSKVGINLGGDLDQVRLQALEVGLTMSEYGEVLKKNATTIALLGTNADDGAKAFRSVNKMLTTGGLGTQLLSLGYSFKDINELTASYIKINGGLTESQKKDTNKLALSVANYGKELDVLSRLTGKSREQLEKEQEAQTQDANFQNYLNGLDEKERDKANAALRLAMESGGKGAADALKAKLMGLPPLTEEAQMYMATMQKGGQSIEEFYNIVKNGKTLQESQLELDKTFGKAIAGNIQDLKQFETVMRAGGMTGDKMAQTLISVQETINKYKQKGLTDEQAIQQAIQEERKKQIEQTKSAAASAAESEKAMKALGSQIMGALLPVFKALNPAMNELATSLMGFVSENMPEIEAAMRELGKYISGFAKDLFSETGRAKIVNDAMYYLKLIWIAIKEQLPSAFGGGKASADIARAELGLEKEKYDRAAEAARIQTEMAGKLRALEKEKDEAKRTTLQQEIDNLKKQEAGAKAAAAAAAKRDQEIKAVDKGPSMGQNVAADATVGAIAGAGIGSIVPVIGTAVGAAVGTALGAATGFFRSLGPGPTALTDEEKAKYNKRDSIPKAATGGFFEGPTSGYPVMLHGSEAVVPLGGMGKKNPLEDFFKKLPSMEEVGSKLKDVANNPAAAMANFTKTIEQFGQKVVETAKPAVKDVQTGLQGTAGALGFGNEKLIQELQTLNKQTGQMLGYIKRSVELDEQHLGAVRGLNGNLFQ